MAQEPAEMTIRLQIQRKEPLAGTASSGDGGELAFEGWMELMGTVAELLGSSDHPCAGNEQPGVRPKER